MTEIRKMTDDDKRVRDQIKTKIANIDVQTFKAHKHRDAYRAVITFLHDDMIAETGCHSYQFVLAVTELVTKRGEVVLPILREILDQYITYERLPFRKAEECFDRDIAFTAFYTIGVYYARVFAVEELHALIFDGAYSACFFKEYPLYAELMVRYYGIAGKCKDQVRIAKYAEKMYARFIRGREEEYNICFMAAYIDAVCSYAQYLYVYNLLDADGVTDAPHQLDISDEMVDSIEGAEYFAKYSVSEAWYPLYHGDIEKAEQYTAAAIAYNGDYGKYYYFKARVMFYKHLITDGDITPQIRNDIDAALDAGKRREGKAVDYKRRISMYVRFGELVANHCSGIASGRELERRKQDILCYDTQPTHEDAARPDITSGEVEDGDYVFISYCSADFKPVYIDLLEMGLRGVRFWYDKGTKAGEDWWENVVRVRLQHATCVVLYLSDNSMQSMGVKRELEAIRGMGKKVYCISMTGEERISDSVKDMVRKNAAKSMDAEHMSLLFDVFSDNEDTILRNNDAMVTTHLDRLYDALSDNFPSTIELCHSEEMHTENNATRHHHVYEDASYRSDAERVWVVADGITRDNKDEYERRPDFSISRVVSEVFATSMGRDLETQIRACNSLEMVKEKLRAQFRKSNLKVHALLHDPENSEDPDVQAALRKYGSLAYTPTVEPPGCVCVVGAFYRNKFVFGSAGDCMGFLVRDEQIMVFSQKQTTYAYDVIDCERDRLRLMNEFVNHAEYEFNYGVVNGDEDAERCFRVSHIDLRRGDVIYLASDGISDYLQFARGEDLNAKGLEAIFEAADELDKRMKVAYSDDKTLIRIHIS